MYQCIAVLIHTLKHYALQCIDASQYRLISPAAGYCYLSYATQLLASIYNVHNGLASTVDHPQLWQMLCIATVRINTHLFCI